MTSASQRQSASANEERSSMSIKRTLAAVLVVIVPTGLAVTAPAFGAKPDIKVIDTDHDGTISLEEAKSAAEQKFDALDKDKDGTIDKAEYLSKVEAAFKKADKDGDGTLETKEFKSASGKILLKLID